jgi:hypothetical protein
MKTGVMGLALAAGLAVSASAQTRQAGRRALERPVVLNDIPVLRVGPGGRPAQNPAPPMDSCNVLAALTDASFTGGSYVVQAGFAQNEMAAATYTVPAAEFPIRINLAEVILATSGATVQTVTEWSMLFYSGTPTAGTLVDTFSSDDAILPHARVGPGTAGVNIQFSVDPSDPAQVIIPDNGTHTFTFAFRIDHHNQQTANPCTTPPPTCCNAFPCTDVSGLAFPAANWLDGLNCGPFGCPPNGGWSTFAGLISLCRPSGDWVMRVTWSGVNCAPGTGACCMPNGTCDIMTAENCTNAGGTYRGDGTACATANCPVPTGACCTATGCGLSTQSECNTIGGTWAGAGTTCNNGQCPTGACCLPDGSCVGGVTSAACTAQSGVFRGPGTACATANCPQPSGGCCFANGGCLIRTQAECTGFGGNWLGAGTTCASCPQPCYANCDASTTAPVLNVADFSCFLNRFAAGDSYANCDLSTSAPVLNVQDFSCFLNQFAAGCS